MSIRILLVDDHQIVRDGLRSWLEAQPDVTVVGEASNGREAVSQARALSPDVVVMDISMPDMNGIDATRQILEICEGVRVIGLSMHSDRRFVSRMLQAGASGFLLKDCAVDELGEAIQQVLRGEVYLSPGIAGVVIDDYVRHLDSAEQLEGPSLTGREREVVQLLAEGKTTKQVALVLHLSVKTIETHRQRIMKKLDLSSLAELTKYAIREGLTDLDD